jgi:parallel beta-helix repeat protein
LKRTLVPLLGLILLLCITSTPVRGVDLERPVDYWVPDDYGTIQDAIDNAPIHSVIGLSRDLETTAMTIDLDRPMVIRGQGTGGVTTVRFVNTVGTYDYVFDVTADHSGLQDLIIEEEYYDIEAGIRVEADFVGINEVEMHGFDERGIWAVGSSDLEVSYCYLDLNGPIADAIILHTSPNAHIIGNTITSSLSTGIDLSYSDDVIIELNEISNCEDDGVHVYSSERATIRDNEISFCGGGIELSWSSNADIDGNLIDQCESYGLLLWNGASDNLVTNNEITNTYLETAGPFGPIITGNGIKIDKIDQPTENNVVKRNLIQDNYVGGYVDISDQNYIYLNDFIDNTEQTNRFQNSYVSETPLAYAYGGNEFTNYLGNYWSDYPGSDTDTPPDGIGEEEYDSFDEYPLTSTEASYTESGVVPEFSITIHTEDGEGVPIEDVQIFLDGVLQGSTNSEGNLEISSLVENDYSISVIKDGFESQTRTETVAEDVTFIFVLDETPDPVEYQIILSTKFRSGRRLRRRPIRIDGVVWRSTPATVDLEEGTHVFVAPRRGRFRGRRIRFSHWEDATGLELSSNRLLTVLLDSDEQLVAVYRFVR